MSRRESRRAISEPRPDLALTGTQGVCANFGCCDGRKDLPLLCIPKRVAHVRRSMDLGALAVMSNVHCHPSVYQCPLVLSIPIYVFRMIAPFATSPLALMSCQLLLFSRPSITPTLSSLGSAYASCSSGAEQLNFSILPIYLLGERHV